MILIAPKVQASSIAPFHSLGYRPLIAEKTFAVTFNISEAIYSYESRGSSKWFWHALALPLFISLALLLSLLWFLHDPSLPITRHSTVILWSDFLSTEDKEGISALVLPNHLCSDVNCSSRDEGLYIL